MSEDRHDLGQLNKSVESLSVSGCSTPTGRKMREPGQRNLQTSTFSISTRPPAARCASPASATCRPPPSPSAVSTILRPRPAEQEESLSVSGCSTPTGRKMREPGQRNLQTSTFSISTRPPAARCASPASATCRPPPSPSAVSTILRPRPAEQEESLSVSGCSTPTGRKMREPGQRNLQTSTFSISTRPPAARCASPASATCRPPPSPSAVSTILRPRPAEQEESLSVSGCSTPTGRKMREPGQRNLQTSTFSISTRPPAARCASPASATCRPPPSPSAVSTILRPRPAEQEESLSVSGCSTPTGRKMREPGQRNLQTSTFSISTRPPAARCASPASATCRPPPSPSAVSTILRPRPAEQEESLSVSGCSTPTGRKMREPGQRNLQTSTFSISTRPPAARCASPASATCRPPPSPSAVSTILRPRPAEQEESLSVSGCSTPTGRKMREPGQRNLQTSTFSISTRPPAARCASPASATCRPPPSPSAVSTILRPRPAEQEESLSVSGCSTPTGRKMREPGQRNLQTSTFSISTRPPAARCASPASATCRPPPSPSAVSTILRPRPAEQEESLSVSGCSTPTGRKMREPGQRNLQTSTFSISNLGQLNKRRACRCRAAARPPAARCASPASATCRPPPSPSAVSTILRPRPAEQEESLSVSGCSTPTGRKMREPGQRNLQTSTFSISTRPPAARCASPASATCRPPPSPSAVSTILRPRPAEQEESLSVSGCSTPTGRKMREPGQRNLQTSTFSISTRPPAARCASPASATCRPPPSPSAVSTILRPRPAEQEESLSVSGCSTPTGRKMREPGQRNLQTSTFSISTRPPAARCASPASATCRPPPSPSAVSTILRPRPAEQEESLSVSGCSTPTGRKMREPGQRNLQTSTFSISTRPPAARCASPASATCRPPPSPSAVSTILRPRPAEQEESLSVSGCSTPTGRKMREPGQRNLQTSTFSISTRPPAARCASPASATCRPPPSPSAVSTILRPRPAEQEESLSVSGCSTPTGRKMREPGQRNLQTSTFSISTRPPAARCASPASATCRPPPSPSAVSTILRPRPAEQEESLSVSGCSTPTGRKMREPGQRNLQTSTFSISKETEGLDTKTSVRVRNPPGGKSSGLW
uniref:Uncharacterized protein n=1 Tax=Heliothis virescens TaxID=7102 RepID=A0A2A4K9Q6_HELVI